MNGTSRREVGRDERGPGPPGTFGFSVTWERGCGPPPTLVGGATRRDVELDASG